MDDKPAPHEPKGFPLLQLWRELRRRHVVRVATVYAVVGWLIIQVASATFASFGIPEWAFRFVSLMVVLGFPIALIIAWAFELTPEGIRVTPSARAAEPPKPAVSSRKRGWLSILFAAGLPTLIFGTLAVFFYFREGGPPPTKAPTEDPAAAASGPSIAVLPFVNLSAVEENAFFAAGVHEDILTQLSRLPGMLVVSRTSVMRYAASSHGVREIAAELGVRFIVEGSVRRINNHVRVTAQLIDASKDAHLWASNYDRELVDVFATQSAVAKEITNSLLLEISPEAVDELSGMPTFSVKAYDLYLKALSIDRSEPESESSLSRQRALLEAAVEADPDFAEAWGFLNEICDHSTRLLLTNRWTIPEEADRETLLEEFRQAADRALNKAIALDPTGVETLLARASDYFREQSDPDFREERKGFLDEALARYPENAIVWYTLAWWHSLGGEAEAATAAFEKALVLDPLHARILYGAIVYHGLQGEMKRADALMTRLPQISTEKYTNPELLRVAVEGQLDGFAFSGDEARLRVIAETIDKGSGNFATDTEEAYYRFLLRTMQLQRVSEASALCEETVPYTPDELHSNPGEILMRLHMAALRNLCAHAGETAKAEQISRDLVEFYDGQDLENVFDIMILAQSFARLGEPERARALAEDARLAEIWSSWARLGALGAVDLEAAAQQFVAVSREDFDALVSMPAYVIFFQDLLEHPKVRAVYVQDGRWLPYLSKRLPAYAQYRVEPAPL